MNIKLFLVISSFVVTTLTGSFLIAKGENADKARNENLSVQSSQATSQTTKAVETPKIESNNSNSLLDASVSSNVICNKTPAKSTQKATVNKNTASQNAPTQNNNSTSKCNQTVKSSKNCPTQPQCKSNNPSCKAKSKSNTTASNILSQLFNKGTNSSCPTITKSNNATSNCPTQSQLNSIINKICGNPPVTTPTTPSVPTTPTKPTTPSVPTTPTTPTTPTAPTTPTQPTTSYSAFQSRIVELVNVERANNGLKPLAANVQLSKVATLKSEDMAKLNYFDHTSPTYGSPFDMMKQFGVSYRTAGENIAMGQRTPEEVMQGWMNSPGHRANILNSSFTQIGVGIAKNTNGQIYWTQQFIG